MSVRDILFAASGVGGGEEPAPEIGDAYGGGYYFGDILQDDGAYRLIMVPKAFQMSQIGKTSDTSTPGTQSMYDGLANTDAMNNAEHPAAQYCRGLTAGGFTDWYLPARDELELLYRNFKPTTDPNSTGTRSAGAGGGLEGENTRSIPAGAAYTTSDPARTPLSLFWSGSGAQSPLFNMTSTEGVGASNTRYVTINTGTGAASVSNKSLSRSVAAIRRELIPPVTPPEAIGDEFQGGFYAGKMNYGVAGQDYYLVVAPKAAETLLRYKTANTAEAVTPSLFDGYANAGLVNDASHPAIQYCANLVIDGYDDWYMPAGYELEVIYRNLKPGALANSTASGSMGTAAGVNPYSIPVGTVYTAGNPAQTPLAKFQSPSGAERLNRYNKCSSQSTQVTTLSVFMDFDNGSTGNVEKDKSDTYVTRPVRRVRIIP